jgi:hypothetical protein
MDIRARIAGAWSLLTGRGDNAVVCSFCGSDRHRVEYVITGPGTTAICNRCVFLCNGILLERSGRPGFARHADGDHVRTTMLSLSHDNPLLAPVERATLEQLLLILVATLPDSRLVGWHYAHAENRFDLLSVEIAAPADVAPAHLQTLANEGWRRIRDAFTAADAANDPPSPLGPAAEAALQAARTYAGTIDAVVRPR